MPSKEHEALVEKVARELCLSDGLDPDQEVIAGQAAGYENFGPRFQSAERSQNICGERNYMADARVAISTILAALQEPTEAMLKEAHKAEDESAVHNYGSLPSATDYWDFMLAASALGEQSE